jgi:hypothetical protein
MAFQLNTSQDGILLNSLQASLMLPHFAYLSTKLLPTKTSDSQPFKMICSWTCLAALQAQPDWHRHSAAPQKEESSSSCCIC